MIQPVFQNEHFIVCDKPAMVLSVPAREKSDDRDCLGRRLEVELKKQIFPVHRLDFEVSGLILFALNAGAHRASQDWFQQKKVRKLYVAQTAHQDFAHWPDTVSTDKTRIAAKEGQSFHWKTQMMRGKRRSFESPHGEWAETEAVMKEVSADRILWNLFPLTGKPHQLRLELSRHGFPIVGDQLYGSKIPSEKPGIFLRAVQLDFSRVKDRFGLPEKIEINA